MIVSHLSPAPVISAPSAAAAARHDVRRFRDAYRGGLTAERASLGVAVKSARRDLRRAVLASRGRRIDLLAILGMLRSDGSPRWALADPMKPLSADNGGVAIFNGEIRYRSSSLHRQLAIDPLYRMISTEVSKDLRNVSVVPAALPPLPPRVRQLAADPAIRRRASMVGVLFQPDEWLELQPDPALIVEWKDLPGEFYALAVWGHDGPGIMEFV